MNAPEREANDAIAAAVAALQSAITKAEAVEYGSQVLAPLNEALGQARYAWETATGQN